MGERNKIDPEVVSAYEETGAFWLPVGNVERQEGFVAGWQARADLAAERERRLLKALKRCVDWLQYHEPSHPEYEGERSDLGREARAVLAEYKEQSDE